MTMICADGAGYQCSGSSIIRVDNGIALSSSGVEAYGVSTSDLAAKNPTMTGAFGLALATGGTAEVRLAKGSDGTVSSSAVLLSKLGLSWDGKTERPPIIDTFSTTQGRTVLTASGALSSTTLPASSDLGFYDYASKGTAGTQVDYANNRYFPRSTPSRCPPDLVPCPTTETSGVHYSPGDWRTGGKMPDLASVSRVHEDGDIHAGNGLPDANGNPTILPGGDGIGVPFPGSKGYRSLDNWGLQYGNLAAWLTQDTVIIEEWAKAGNEHNKNRRGMVAYGDVTNPTAVPTSGTASYSGFAYGWYTPNGTAEPAVFRGTVVVSVNFATRQTTVTFQNPVTWDSAGTSVPVALTTTVPMGAAGSNVANYLTGPVTNGALTGGVGGRYFGPVLTTGTSGAGPAEIGGTITLSNATSGQTVLGGFIARKQ
ncbi:hypothetical protein [Noviherbaspirillum sp.]|uniref:hypothetical protein n=1 Tax=Noviherbaspirillum sp. TaxID=1926288 RepID=UPI002B489E63|nr:hypothetical protein [Noviherbaspirillum sp.]HJV82877.1 hypothetical protein [Noviherbaspirillum sp.]